MYRTQLARDDLDYVIGSVHTVDGHHIYRPSAWPEDLDIADLHLRCHQAIQGAVGSRLFGVLAHLDALKVFAPAPEREDVACAVTASLDAIADSGIVVEVNTAGLRKCGDPCRHQRSSPDSIHEVQTTRPMATLGNEPVNRQAGTKPVVHWGPGMTVFMPNQALAYSPSSSAVSATVVYPQWHLRCTQQFDIRAWLMTPGRRTPSYDSSVPPSPPPPWWP